ncbi:MAG: hypothetical protein A2Y12_08865 [Planctomycetes bacterium GWF2_42_9]|nr:MAG: hypothetical protein A2Y12_08865 [Planctomycetes bacterium GWF2_42_9]HAL45509.1 hypothetical protein [Phycisphaerales bacterium]
MISHRFGNEPSCDQCESCKFASANKTWCCKFGFYFKKPDKKIIQPQNKIILADQNIEPVKKQKPTLLRMAADFTQAMVKWGASGLKCVDKDEYVRRRSICSECTPQGWRCPHCGCMLWAKVALATERCPQNKW